MVERPEHDHATAADAVAQREQVVERVDVERHVLHRPRGERSSGVAGVGQPEHAVVGVLRVLHEGDVAVVAQLDEPVERVGHPVHPVERLQFATEHIGEEGDLGLDVGGAEGKVVDAVRMQGHNGPPLVRSFGRGWPTPMRQR